MKSKMIFSLMLASLLLGRINAGDEMPNIGEVGAVEGSVNDILGGQESASTTETSSERSFDTLAQEIVATAPEAVTAIQPSFLQNLRILGVALTTKGIALKQNATQWISQNPNTIFNIGAGVAATIAAYGLYKVTTAAYRKARGWWLERWWLERSKNKDKQPS